jgi:mobilization protein NikA
MASKIRQMNFRATEEEMTAIKLLAKQRKISVSELILLSIKNVPLKDYSHEKEFLPHLLQLIKELRYLNNNINQATIVLHQVNNGHKYSQEELAVFNTLLKEDIRLKEILVRQLDQRMYK